MKFCTARGLQKVVLRFEFSELWGVKICPFSLIWALVYTKSFTVSQQIKEVIGNRHEKLNKLMIAQTRYLLPAKIIKIGSSVLKL